MCTSWFGLLMSFSITSAQLLGCFIWDIILILFYFNEPCRGLEARSLILFLFFKGWRGEETNNST